MCKGKNWLILVTKKSTPTKACCFWVLCWSLNRNQALVYQHATHTTGEGLTTENVPPFHLT